MVGGGGCGSSYTDSGDQTNQGGGSAGYTAELDIPVVGGTPYQIIIGKGGVGGANQATVGDSGDPTSFTTSVAMAGEGGVHGGSPYQGQQDPAPIVCGQPQYYDGFYSGIGSAAYGGQSSGWSEGTNGSATVTTPVVAATLGSGSGGCYDGGSSQNAINANGGDGRMIISWDNTI